MSKHGISKQKGTSNHYYKQTHKDLNLPRHNNLSQSKSILSFFYTPQKCGSSSIQLQNGRVSK